MPRTRSNVADPENGGRAKVRESEVLDVAAQAFYERGYASTSVQLIADELGILKGSLYYYIKNKEDLLFRLLDEVHRELGSLLGRARATSDKRPLERLYMYVNDQVDYAARNIPKIAIYYRDVDQLAEEHRRNIFERRSEHQEFVRDLIEQAQRAGVARTDDAPTVLANFIFGSFIWTYRWYHASGTMTPTQLADAAARFAVNGIQA